MLPCRYAGFLKSTLAQHGGLGKVTGLVSDREAVCVRTSQDLQRDAPHLVLVYCQGHGELPHATIQLLHSLVFQTCIG